MGDKWIEVSLSEIAERIGDGLHGTPKYSEQGKYHFINGNNLEDGVITIKESTKKVGFEQYKKHKKELNENAILVSINGTIGNVALYNDEEIILGKSACYINLKDNIHREFVAYVLTSFQFQEYIQRCATGSTIKNVSLKMMREFAFRIPEDEVVQIDAVATLKNIDLKIRLNRQTNQTLEQMAQALFKSWFVDFDPVFDNAFDAGLSVDYFPDELQHRAMLRQQHRSEALQQGAEAMMPQTPQSTAVLQPQNQQATQTESERIRGLFPSEFEQCDDPNVGINGWIPKGWVASSFESLINLIGGGTPKTSVDEFWGGEIPWFSVVDAPKDSDVFVIDTEKHITQLGVDKSSTKLLRKGTTIISARGTVGKCALVGEPMAMNQSCYGINGLKGVSDEYIYFLTRYQVSDLQKRGHGSVFNTITRETFKAINLAFCGTELTQQFSYAIKPFLNKILLNNKQIVELANTRDILLPKLISGEIQVNKDVTNEPLEKSV